jgi:hypothetical protein
LRVGLEDIAKVQQDGAIPVNFRDIQSSEASEKIKWPKHLGDTGMLSVEAPLEELDFMAHHANLKLVSACAVKGPAEV